MNPHNNANLISRAQLASVVNSKATMYDSLIANGFVMPNKKQKILTIETMWRIKDKVLWWPRREYVTAEALCAKPPTIKILTQLIRTAIANIVINDQVDSEA